jgi:hypothetical protein
VAGQVPSSHDFGGTLGNLLPTYDIPCLRSPDALDHLFDKVVRGLSSKGEGLRASVMLRKRYRLRWPGSPSTTVQNYIIWNLSGE